MAMQGSLRDMSVADIIQVNCQDKKTARASIQQDGKLAYIFFFNGAVTHAVLNDLIGEEVIYQLLAWDHGDFIIENDLTPPHISIKRNWSGLLLEGAKRLDESHPDQSLELGLEMPSSTDKDALIQGLLERFSSQSAQLNSLGLVGIDGFVKQAIHKNSVDEVIFGSVGAAYLNLGKRSLGLLRMDSFEKSVISGANNTILVCVVNRYTLLVSLYSVSMNTAKLDWSAIDALVTDLSALL
jgi:predicted regulator of Ras-like GTPase activity (Roadblock/LC7/MglB family)